MASRALEEAVVAEAPEGVVVGERREVGAAGLSRPGIAAEEGPHAVEAAAVEATPLVDDQELRGAVGADIEGQLRRGEGSGRALLRCVWPTGSSPP